MPVGLVQRQGALPSNSPRRHNHLGVTIVGVSDTVLANVLAMRYFVREGVDEEAGPNPSWEG